MMEVIIQSFDVSAMQTLSGPPANQPLATSAVVESSGAAGRLTLKPAAASPPRPAPQAGPLVLMPPWELRGAIVDKLA